MNLDDYHKLFAEKPSLAPYMEDLRADLGTLPHLSREKQDLGQWFETKEEVWLGRVVDGLCKSLLLWTYCNRVALTKPIETDETAHAALAFLNVTRQELDFLHYTDLPTLLSLDITYLKTREFLPDDLCNRVRRLHDDAFWKSELGKRVLSKPEHVVCSRIYNVSSVNSLRKELASLTRSGIWDKTTLSLVIRRDLSYISATDWNSFRSAIPGLERNWLDMAASISNRFNNKGLT